MNSPRMAPFPWLHAMNPQPVLKSPADCSEAELAAFEAALIENGETPSPALADRIRRADCLAFVAGDDGGFRATGALKHPKPEHCAGVFKRAAAQAPPESAPEAPENSGESEPN